MNKTIEKIETYKAKEITKAMEKAQQGYEEAKDFFLIQDMIDIFIK